MSSRREVLVRILALLQRETLIETKICTLKCLKWHYLTAWSMKNVAALTEDGAFALFFRPLTPGIWQLRSPHPREFAIQGKKKKMLMTGEGYGRSRNWLMHYHHPLSKTLKSRLTQVYATRTAGRNSDQTRGGGYFRNFWVVMCCWDPGNLNLYQSYFSWILLAYTRVNSPNPPYPRVAIFQKLVA